MAHDVFISYSHQDMPAADATCAALEAAGLRCWMAPRDISPGAEWGEAIVGAIDEATVMVLIFSSNANESRQVRREVEHAVSREVTIMPVRIEPAEPERSLAYFMAGLHWLDAMTPPLDRHLQRLVASIKLLVETAGRDQQNRRGPQREAQPLPAHPTTPTLREVNRRRFFQKPAFVLSILVAGLLVVAGVWTLIPQQPPVTVAEKPVPVAGESQTKLAALSKTFRDCADCPEMVTVPVGHFMMGSDPSEQDSQDNERPRHAVTVKKTFAVGAYHVTRGEYAKFVDAGGRETACPSFSQTDRDPVVCVSWDDAKAYATWLSKITGKTYRLLTEAEWEYAARAGTTSEWYWGDTVGANNANCDGCGTPWDKKGTSPAGSFKANGFGLYDMLGNAWQWVEDCYVDSYRETPIDGSAYTSGVCTGRVRRGGSWFFGPQVARAAFRTYSAADGRNYTGFGFRVARTIGP